ncbi:MAG: hypothetical protein HZA90_17055, partial [Verrucomicrobia bacterium]|nr:hypothetical protein [Verrucomicrobiota bacterium]
MKTFQGWTQLSFALLSVCLLPLAVHASGTVTTPTEASLNTALANGGLVTFACDGTITLTSTKVIATNTTLEAAGHTITLSGGNAVRLFTVNSNATLTLLNLTLADGQSTNGGAIYNHRGANLAISNCVLTRHRAVGSHGSDGANGADNPNGNQGGDGGAGANGTNAAGGALYNLGAASIVASSFLTNSVVGGNGGNGGRGGSASLSFGVGGDGGSGGQGATAQGGAIYSAFTITLQDCTFAGNQALAGHGGWGGTNGIALSYGNRGYGGTGASALGGSLYAAATSAVERCSFLSSLAQGGSGRNGGTDGFGNGDTGRAGGAGLGGAIYLAGTNATLTCLFENNQAVGGAGGSGGGIKPIGWQGGNGGSGGSASGGGLCNAGTNWLLNCAFSGNLAVGGTGGPGESITGGTGGDGGSGNVGYGGGLYSSATNAVVNCTFYANAASGGSGGPGGNSGSSWFGGDGGNGNAGFGGGLCSSGRTALTNVTCASEGAYGGAGGSAGTGGSGNGTAGSAGSAAGANLANTGITTNFLIKNTLLAYPTSGNNASGSFSNAGYNLSSDTTPAFGGLNHSTNNTDPRLAPLADNGGWTMTCALLAGSPAIDAGDTNACLPADQRGVARLGPCDLGAFELLPTMFLLPERGWASEQGDVAVASVSRGDYLGPITAQYTISGSASNGVDYALITNSVTLSNGVTAARLFIRPVADGQTEPDEKVIFTLLAATNYLIGIPTAEVTIHEQSRLDSTKRYVRGTGTTPAYHSVVVPLDFEAGVKLADVGGNAATLFPSIPWTNTLYHFDATNPAVQTNITGRMAFQNPIVAFGSRVGGTPLHVGQTYRFGVLAGANATTNSPLRIKVYNRTNFALLGTMNVSIPLESQTNAWLTFATNGYSQIVATNGFTTVVTRQAMPRWGSPWHHSYILSHSANTNALSYLFEVECLGSTDGGWTVLNATNGFAYSKLYTVEFESRPPWRATFIHQPHFAGQPLPPAYQGKSTEELLTASTFLATNPLPAEALNWTNLDASPDLRRHPILDQLVADLNGDPLALANYVCNEIELTDAFGYDDDGTVSEASVNPAGVNRGALATYLEGQGSPLEQCALLVYLLRQAHVPAAYVFPAEDSLKLLDTRLSSLLRLQLRGAVDDLGQAFTTNRLIAVNYPWVAARVGTNWVHLFPWLKDTEMVEGFNLYDFMPTNYNNAYKWVRDYLYGNTNLLALSSDDDTPATLFPKFVEQVLLTNAPGLSLDDMGVRAVNRRHHYARWSDFPRPTVVGSSNVVAEHLCSSALTNLSPYLTNLFDTVSVEVYSVANPSTRLVSGELRMADLHNRKFLIRHEKITATQHRLIMSLAPYRPDITNEVEFSAVDPNAPADPDILKKLATTNTLGATDDDLRVKFVHTRQRTLPTGWVVPSFWETFPGYSSSRVIEIERPLRKGDLAALCLNAGRVTRRMLQVHAEEQWQMEQTLGTNALATNSLPADRYQGTPAYLKGMAYYEKVSRFTEWSERLHKVKSVSWFAAGLARLNAARECSGQLCEGNIDLRLPAVDMFYRSVGLVGNGSLHPDSGQDDASTRVDFSLLATADGSAQEHAILNQFLLQKEAVSTVKLLRLAQQRGTNGQPGVILLTKNNYLTEGSKPYPTNGVTLLKDHDPQLWASVAQAFTGGVYAADPDYSQVFITPWPVTNATASYAGMAAMVITPTWWAGLITGSLNGGAGEQVPSGSFGPANSPNQDLNVDAEGNYSLRLTAPTAGNHQAAPEATSQADVATVQTQLDGGVLDANPTQTLQGDLNGQILNGQTSTYNNNYDDTTDRGSQGRADDRLGNGKSGTVADPVNTLTGEFYVDAVDLTLPGPMPLHVRRNYGSHNLAANQLGYGWKLNYMPFLTASSTNFYVAEPDGSVLVFAPIAADLWAPSLTNNPTLNNHSVAGIGSVANRFNARLRKVSTTYYLTNADGSLRVFEEKSFPLSAGIDRARPYLTTWFDNRSNFFRFEYGTNSTQPDYGQVRRVLSSSGNLVGFQYDVYGRITLAYTLDGRQVSYRYDEHGDLVEVVLPDASEWGFEYEHQNWTTNNTTYVYSTHLLTRELKPDGRALRNQYDAQRRVTNQWATVGADLRLIRNASFSYVNGFNLTNLTALLTGTTTVLDYTNRALTYYYTNSLIRKIVDPLSRTTWQKWYEVTNTTPPAYPRSLQSVTDPRGLLTTYLYDDRGNVTNATVRGDLRGDGDTNATAVTVSVFNANNLPTKTISPSGTTNLFFYTNTWLLARMETWPSNATSAQAVTNLFVYHTVTNADGTAAYGLRQREIRAAYSSDAATNEWDHDSRGFITRATRYTGTADPAVIVTNIHNVRGELIEQTDAAGRTTRFAHDARGRLEQREVFEAGQSTPLAWEFSYYNPNGERVWSDGPRFDPEDYVWRDYDGDGRLSTVLRWRTQARTDGTGVEAPVGDALFSTTFYAYDPFGNQVRSIDPRGVLTTNTFDAVGQLLVSRVLDTNGTPLATNGFAYEPGGQVRFHTNALGGVTETHYTTNGLPKYRRHPDGSTNAWRYYTDGRLYREVQANGAYWETAYDDANRTTKRIFYSSAGTPLATNSTVLDRRGNVIQRTDEAGNIFTNLFDGLDRLKLAVGPVATNVTMTTNLTFTTNLTRQLTACLYDTSGEVLIVTNALGETTVTTRDALDRVLSVATYPAGSTNPVRVTQTAYTTNHHGATVWAGTGANAIATTTYTDPLGHLLLAIGYPSATALEYTLRDFDADGNLEFEGRYSNTNGSVALWQTNAFTYDGLNRLKTQTVRDGATTTFAYNALGNLTNRVMPGGLKWQATFNNAGQITKEWNLSTNNLGVRTNAYSYYPSNSALAGLLATNLDNRGVTNTLTYDPWLRVATNSCFGALTQQTLTTVWQYDVRGLLTNATEQFTNSAIGPTTAVQRKFDPYGQLSAETVLVGGTTFSSAAQNWEVTGRRSTLSLNSQPSTLNFAYAWRADGLLASVSVGQLGSAGYDYDTGGFLTTRTVGARVTTTGSRDGTARPLSITTTVNGSTKLTETLAWTGDGLLSTHTLERVNDFTDSRAYLYASPSRRLVEERLNLDATKRWTNTYTFDNATAAGPGVLTKVGQASGLSPS